MSRFFALLFCLLPFAGSAQSDSSHLRVSLLTCGTGPQVWETFGHTAVRVTDSMRGTDNVYNYGTFNGFDENFELKFMRGKLLYYLSCYPFPDFMREYIEAGRSVKEQVLLMDGQRKKDIYAYLQWNAMEENKYYKYDFFFDNCATRIRDIFPNTYGRAFQFGRTLPKKSKLTFRDIINQYFYRDHFTRFGVNLLLGAKVDSIMTNEDVMFLPDYLEKGIAGATLNGHPIATPPEVLLNGSPVLPAPVNWVFVLTMSICMLIIAGFIFPSLRWLGKALGNLLLFLSGVIGIVILVMWFFTDHQGCSNNFNILWALPSNLFLAFAGKKHKDRYAVAAMILLFVSLVLHVLRIQQMPLLELFPVLLGLLFTYGMIYRSGTQKSA